MNQTAFIICGPTATGKTSVALELAKKVNGEIISADSRQIYKGMDIGTGKSLPKNAQINFSKLKSNKKLIPYYLIDDIKIWGYDLAEPNEEFSVAEYQASMNLVLESIITDSKIPIIVGGTGFYINSLINPPETIGIPQNLELRNKLLNNSVEELQQRLKKLDLTKFEKMNPSDINNPRRLIRAIEVSDYKVKFTKNNNLKKSILANFALIKIGLTADLIYLKEMVQKNVQNRQGENFTTEIIELEKAEFDWRSPAASATGYKEWKAYLAKKISKDEAIELWINREHQYQKRQLTWFKKQNVKWFNVREKNINELVADILDAC
jgi:tRNA dimethylallyltransferase